MNQLNRAKQALKKIHELTYESPSMPMLSMTAIRTISALYKELNSADETHFYPKNHQPFVDVLNPVKDGQTVENPEKIQEIPQLDTTNTEK